MHCLDSYFLLSVIFAESSTYLLYCIHVCTVKRFLTEACAAVHYRNGLKLESKYQLMTQKKKKKLLWNSNLLFVLEL